MAIGEESGWSNDDTATGNDRPPAGEKRLMIREGGSTSRVSIKARPRDPGGGTVSTDPRRRIVLYDVIVSVEQPREEPTLVSHTDSTAQTGQVLAEDTHIQECSHDVVGLYAHKGTMWITDDRVPQKNIKLPCGGGVLTLPGAAGGLLPAMFPVASALPIDEPQLDSWQVIVVRVDETPARDSSEQEPPCDSQNRRRPMDMNYSLNILVHTVVQGGPVGPQEKEPLALLVLDHANPAGWHAVVQKKLLGPAGPKVKEPLALLALIHADPAGQRAAVHRAVSLRECLPAQLEPPNGDGLLEVILILLASWTVSPRDCVMETKLEWEPVITPADSYDLDSRPMEGTTYLEHPAPAVYLDSWLVRGASYPQPHVNWEVLNSKPSLNNVTIVKMVDTDASDDVNTHLPDKVTPMSTPMTAPAWSAAVVSNWQYSHGCCRIFYSRQSGRCNIRSGTLCAIGHPGDVDRSLGERHCATKRCAGRVRIVWSLRRCDRESHSTRPGCS